MSADIWKNELQAMASPEKAKILSGFFKTGKGEYGEGDIFIGLTTPQNRSVAKRHINDPFEVISEMLHSPIHEHRISAVFALVYRYERCKKDDARKEIVDFYLAHTAHINNWDLVDLSCHYILGDYLCDRQHDILFALSDSTNLWEQRIAIVSTLMFIRRGHFDTTLALAEKYLTHTHDLIHKATGWMLREVGKRDTDVLRTFLNANAHRMPRTALRYAIEKFSPLERSHYLSIKKQY